MGPRQSCILGGGLRKNGGLLIEWPSDWAVGIDDGWRARGQLYQVLIWDESDEGGDDWVGTHMYVGAVVTRRTWDWTDTEEYGEMRTEDSDWGNYEWWGPGVGRNRPDKRAAVVTTWGRPRRVITTVDAQGWYFHRYPWSPLGRQADFEAARAMEAEVEFEQVVLRENQRQFVEDVEAQGRQFLAASEEERFMELVISEEQAERVITGEDYQRLAYLWAMQRCELRAHWMAQLARERARPEPSAPPLTGTRTPGPGATSSAAAQNSELREQGQAEQRPQPPASPKPWWKWQ